MKRTFAHRLSGDSTTTTSDEGTSTEITITIETAEEELDEASSEQEDLEEEKEELDEALEESLEESAQTSETLALLSVIQNVIKSEGYNASIAPICEHVGITEYATTKKGLNIIGSEHLQLSDYDSMGVLVSEVCDELASIGLETLNNKNTSIMDKMKKAIVNFGNLFKSYRNTLTDIIIPKLKDIKTIDKNKVKGSGKILSKQEFNTALTELTKLNAIITDLVENVSKNLKQTSFKSKVDEAVVKSILKKQNTSYRDINKRLRSLAKPTKMEYANAGFTPNDILTLSTKTVTLLDGAEKLKTLVSKFFTHLGPILLGGMVGTAASTYSDTVNKHASNIRMLLSHLLEKIKHCVSTLSRVGMAFIRTAE